VEVDDGGPVRPGARRRGAGEQKLLDTVQCHLLRQRLRGTQSELRVIGVHRNLLELVPGDGTGGLRRLRLAPPRPAAAILAGCPSACSGNQKWFSRVLTVTPENGTPSPG
jgi:hypothetical protein